MFVQTWKKYLPVIVLLMKRSDKGEQVLNMNYTDFERAAGGKKIKLVFPNIVLTSGKVSIDTKYPAVASELVLLLQQDERSALLMKDRIFEFAMNSDFQLTIRNNTQAKDIQIER